MKKSSIITIGVCISVVLVLLFLPNNSYSQIPQTISHQGYLTDSIGDPIDDTVTITFSLYNLAAGGTELWTETQTLQVIQGVYSVVLGGGTPAVPVDLPFDEQYWLGVKVESDNEMTPRQALTSVPYALNSAAADYALDAEKINGIESTALQSRVTGVCAVGSSIRQIHDDGSVICEQDDGILTESDPTVNTLAKTTLSCQQGESVQWDGAAWVCGSSATCNSGDFIYCYSGLQGTLDKGICKAGTRQCTVQGVLGSCVGDITPLSEVCDALDNDCDELVDEDAVCGLLTFARVSVDSSENQGNGGSRGPSISADGRYVVFQSSADNLVLNDTNGQSDIFVRDRLAGTTTRVSVDPSGNGGDGGSREPSISGDGLYVAFQSSASNLVANDTNGRTDIFVRDLQANTTTRISVDSIGIQGNSGSRTPSVNGDGRFIAFESDASNLVTGDTGGTDCFVHDLLGSTTIRVSLDSDENEGNAPSYYPSISADGSYVVFESLASNLVPNDTNGKFDVFVRNLTAGTTTRASVDSDGNEVNGFSNSPAISADGGHVVFQSLAYNLVPNDTNGQSDIFVRDLQTNTTTRVSVDSNGNEVNDFSNNPVVSADGRYVVFESDATNLVSNDNNLLTDVFVRDLQAGSTIRVSVDSNGNQADGGSFLPAISNDGNYVVYESEAKNLVPNDTNATYDIFIAQVP